MSTRNTVVALLAMFFLVVILAPAQTTTRSLDEFVAAQGTSSINTFFMPAPPVNDFWYWMDLKTNKLAGVDYAGVANRCFNNKFPTTIEGSVSERPLPDGRAEITVLMFTKNALMFAQATSEDWPTAQIIFGSRWDFNKPCGAWSGGNNYVLGNAFMQVKFMIPYPGAPLPDLVDVLFFTDQWNDMIFHARGDTTLGNGDKLSLLVEQTTNVHRMNAQVQIVKVKK